MTPTRISITPMTPATTTGLQLVVAYLHWPTCLVEEHGAVQRLLVRAEAAVRTFLGYPASAADDQPHLALVLIDASAKPYVTLIGQGTQQTYTADSPLGGALLATIRTQLAAGAAG